MKFKRTKIFNFEGAIRGMRNPMNSWDRSDSICCASGIDGFYEDLAAVAETYIDKNLELYSEEYEEKFEEISNWLSKPGKTYQLNCSIIQYDLIGKQDLELAQRLVRAGDEHAKFMRQIFVSTDIIAPLYWWKEFDTYKIGTTANSTSTMHKLVSKPFEIHDFEFDNVDLYVTNYTIPHGGECGLVYNDYIEDILDMCNNLRKKYLATKDKRYWRALVQILPSSYLQTRTWTANYAVLRNIYFQRKNHKLEEWHQFCDWIKTLPYANELIILGDENETN